MTGKGWSKEENQLAVEVYFEMLEAELLGQPYNKAEHLRALVTRLPGRSENSPEFKHQNISAVLVEHGLPYIDGYKPLGNFQNLLAEEVEAFLERDPTFFNRLKDAPLVNPTSSNAPSQPDISKIIESAPDRVISPRNDQKPWLTRRPQRIDFAKRDANNRRLGKLGEQFVFDLEQYRLNQAGRDDLAQKVLWVSRDIRDGLGFDILSYDENDDSERMLEVKTTGMGKYFPFYVTLNELLCSEDIPNQFHLYRVFNIGRSPHLYILKGALSDACILDPVLYRAVANNDQN